MRREISEEKEIITMDEYDEEDDDDDDDDDNDNDDDDDDDDMARWIGRR